VVDINYDPFFDLLGSPLLSIGVPCAVPMSELYILLYSMVSYCTCYERTVWFVSYSVPRLSRKDAGICDYCTVGRDPAVLIRYTVYRIIVYSRT
jgi:hypothetical protein